ncbi:cyclic GMP-AMP synthase-like receptor 3 isoform X2 [Ptychodera flava]|uniref:cyclic GMP-AMP synthase-like receptor 3 isoform X2 n=1 Tax=Ptychodera flava TaxID=63121 RepID=UPI003969D515
MAKLMEEVLVRPVALLFIVIFCQHGDVRGTTKLSTIALDEFYDKKVNIPDARMDAAKTVVREIEAILKPRLTKLLDLEYDITMDQNWKYTGSAFENLKVFDPDDFDIMIPFDMTHHLERPNRKYTDSSSSPQFSFAECQTPKTAFNFLHPANGSSKFSSWYDDIFVLDSKKVMSGFHSVLQKAVNLVNFGDKRVWIGQDGPAMKVQATYKDQNKEHKLKIDMVVAVSDCDRYYVAKSDKYDTAVGAKGKWRLSYSDEEKKAILSANTRGDKSKVFKLVKAFCKKDGPLAGLESYYLKTVYLHMLDKYPGQWTDTSEFFVIFLEELLTFLQTRNLPMYFLKQYNLIDNFSQNNPVTLTDMTRRLEKLLKKGEGELIKILKRMTEK